MALNDCCTTSAPGRCPEIPMNYETDEADSIPKRALRVACIFSAKKQKNLNYTALREIAQRCNLSLELVNPAESLHEQGPFDIILHKLTDELCKAWEGDPVSHALVESVEEYIQAHPGTAVIDPLDSVRTLLDRRLTCEIMTACEVRRLNGPSELGPPYIVVNQESIDPAALTAASLSYPVIVKRIVAHSKKAHQMAIVYNTDGLAAVQGPCVVQRFINHGAAMVKLFVVGETIFTEIRPSIRNQRAGPTQTVHFDSASVSKADSASALNEIGAHKRALSYNPEFLLDLVRRIKVRLGLQLFGVDVVIEEGTGDMYVVDINYFPGYAGIEEFPSCLCRLLMSSVIKAN